MPSETNRLPGDQKPSAPPSGQDGGRRPHRQDWRPVNIAAKLGALAVAVLPVGGVIWKAIICGYGLNSDFSGVAFLMPIIIGLGAVVGFVAGLIGVAAGALLQHLTDAAKGPRFGAVLGYVLAIGAAGLLSLVPFALFMFPDC